MPKVTIQSMAKELGLSRNTVSMALNNSELVAPNTKKKVLQYAQTKGYTKLTTDEYSAFSSPGGLRNILVLQRREKGIYWDKIITGIAEEARLSRCTVSISIITSEDVQENRLPVGYNENVDALFFLSSWKTELDYIKSLTKGKTGIFLDKPRYHIGDNLPGDVIKSEGRKGVYQITRALIKQGLKRIAFVCAYSTDAETVYDRFEGYQCAMEESGLPLINEYVVKSTSVYLKDQTVEEILNNFSTLPDAIVCANDETAKRITRILNTRGIRVPEDIAITGFDNDESDVINPFFTTVDVDVKSLGKRMVQQLLWRMEHPNAPYEVITLPTKVIYRESSKKGLLTED